jgi:hypothetical protein
MSTPLVPREAVTSISYECNYHVPEAVNNYHRVQATGAAVGEFRDKQAQQLEYLSERARSLEDVVGQGSVLDIKDARKEVLLNLRRFRENLTQEERESSTKTSL